jgi:hypothetical protein
LNVPALETGSASRADQFSLSVVITLDIASFSFNLLFVVLVLRRQLAIEALWDSSQTSEMLLVVV